MFEIEETVASDAPIETVWASVTDESNSALWQATLSEVSQSTSGPLDVGGRVQGKDASEDSFEAVAGGAVEAAAHS